jgi:RNase adaptor protein for sRNA GlmZ degradation
LFIYLDFRSNGNLIRIKKYISELHTGVRLSILFLMAKKSALIVGLSG